MAVELLSKLPVGFRFHPTDEEMVTFYLQPKISGNAFDVTAIAEVDLCQWEPWELPNKSKIKSKDRVWWFLCPEHKCPNSERVKRTTNTGFWKITGQKRDIKRDDTKVKIATKKSLTFYSGPTPGKRTNWTIQEISLDRDAFGFSQQMASYVICKLKKKTDEKADTPEGESVSGLGQSGSPPSAQTVNSKTETNHAVSSEDIDPLDWHLPAEDISQYLSFDEQDDPFAAFSSEESHDESLARYNTEGDLCFLSAQGLLKRPYINELPAGSEIEAEAVTELDLGYFDPSHVGSKKVRQMRMSNTPSYTLQSSGPSQHFAQQQSVISVSDPVPVSQKESFSKSLTTNNNKPVGDAIRVSAVESPQSPKHVAVTGGTRQKRIQFQKNDSSSSSSSSSPSSMAIAMNTAKEAVNHVPRKEIVVGKGNAERRLKSASRESSTSEGSSVFCIVERSSLSICHSLSPLEYCLNAVVGTVLFIVFVRELVVFRSW